MMLIHADQERALNYLSTCIDQVNSFGDILQLVIVELIYKVSKTAGVNYICNGIGIHCLFGMECYILSRIHHYLLY